MTELATRGTTNRNERGSTIDRAARRLYLINTYMADKWMLIVTAGPAGPWRQAVESDATTNQWCLASELPHATIVPTCRCYRCGELLTVDTVTVDRIIPGCQGGTYRRNNIRPACGTCNSSTGGKLRSIR